MGYDPVELATRVVESRLSVTEWVDREGCGIGKTSVYRALNKSGIHDLWLTKR